MSAPRLLLLIPPLTQLNTPYPSAAYLTGFLKRHGYATGEAPVSAGGGGGGGGAQAGGGVGKVLGLFFRGGPRRGFDRGRVQPGDPPGGTPRIVAPGGASLALIGGVIRVLP